MAQSGGNNGWHWRRQYGQALIWVLLALNALAIVVTYSRLPAEEFYHVSRDGLAGGLGRALVFSNFPAALIAIATIAVSWLALRGSSVVASSDRRRLVTASAIVATALCLVTAFPGVADAGDLDAKPVNAVPFLGVLMAIGLSVLAIRAGNWPGNDAWTWRDRVSVAIVAVATCLSLPWIVADLGFYIDEMPVIGRLFIASDVPPGETLAAVHLGHHHGLDGLLFMTSALVLNHLTRNRSTGRLATALSIYLALLFTYGAFNLANDGWLEQVAKRGWVEWRIPSVLTPDLSLVWGLVIISTIIVWFVLFRSSDTAPAVEQPRATFEREMSR